MVAISCRKTDSLPDEVLQDSNQVKQSFFKVPLTVDPEIKKVAKDLENEKGFIKNLSKFIKKNGIPKWDKAIFKVSNKSNGSFRGASDSSDSQGLFLIPLQSTTSADVKSYITCYKHNDSAYTYRLYNKDSLNSVRPANDSSKARLLNAQAVFGYFEKKINNKDTITVNSPAAGKIKDVLIDFKTGNNINGRNSAALSSNCSMTIELIIYYEWQDTSTSWAQSEGWVAVGWELHISITCEDNESVEPAENDAWYNSGTGSPSQNTYNNDPYYDPNWYYWWTGGTGYESRSIYDYNTGDEDNNTDGNYDNTSYLDYDSLTQTWPTISNVIPVADFVGWGTPGIIRNCMNYAKAQIAKKGYQISNYGAPGQTVQIYKATNGVNTAAAKNGVGYLLSALQRGIPVIVGVDDQPGSPNPNTDNTTDHFVVIVGSGSDSNGNYFTFYDNASGNPLQGTNANNKLYYNAATGLIRGKSQTDYASGLNDYTVTMIRKSK